MLQAQFIDLTAPEPYCRIGFSRDQQKSRESNRSDRPRLTHHVGATLVATIRGSNRG
jgi:hypothetical protein